MNALSLVYFNAQKQESWKDDPFGFNGLVTGVTKISDNQQNLKNYALEMVASFGKFKSDHYELTLDMLSSPYQLEFARLYIESIDREIESACYGDDQSINSDFICALLAMLKDSNPRTRAKFAQVTTVNVLTYYKDTLNNLLETACEDFYSSEMYGAGYRCEQDMEHGDFVWRR